MSARRFEIHFVLDGDCASVEEAVNAAYAMFEAADTAVDIVEASVVERLEDGAPAHVKWAGWDDEGEILFSATYPK